MKHVVLVTGFGSFPGAAVNPTTPLVRALAASRRAEARGWRVIAHVFRTRYAAVDHDLPRLIEAHRPDAVLMFGLATRTPFLRIETRARNRRSIRFPDAGGQIAPQASIDRGGPASLRGRAAFAWVLRAAKAAGAPMRLSRDAGDYLCNYAYWRMLETAPKAAPVLFVHVPKPRLASRRPGKRPGLTPRDLVAAGEAMLLALLAARR